mmetsp:Transcript_23181/g.54206  ORF Transcript_23181/g.54206 Transcript_23181/m.54206 type:complete len:204 (-) Transcript_23181:881-1492(-)
MRLDGCRVVWPTAHPLSCIPFQQLLDEGPGRRAEEGRVARVRLENLKIHFFLVLGVEGREANKHLVDENAQAPPVHCLAVSLLRQHLRGHVLRRPTEGVRRLLRSVADVLGQAEVGQLDVTVCGQKQVLWFQVTVDEAHGVQVLQGQHHLGRVEARTLLGKTLLFLKVGEELTTIDVVQDHIQLVFRLEGVFEVDKEGVLHAL